MRLEILAVLVLWVGAPGAVQATIIEETIKVPVSIVNGRGARVEQEIVVSLFHESSAPKPYPVAVLNHGRSGDAAERNALRTGPYAAAARWFAEFGFMVAVPVRIGYGATSGEDVEDSGACDRKDYPPGFQAAALQTVAVVNALRKRPDISKDRGLILGQSFGGTTAITVASIDPPGIQGAINFAGGGGGGPKSHPQRPCGEPKLRRLFAGYGNTARIPTLWLYSENDQYFGPRFPPEWFEAFKASGGRGQLIMFPAVGSDGHLLFSRGTDMWQPRVQEFLRSLGFSPLARTGRQVQQMGR